jgi:hypothetical protein
VVKLKNNSYEALTFCWKVKPVKIRVAIYLLLLFLLIVIIIITMIIKKLFIIDNNVAEGGSE